MAEKKKRKRALKCRGKTLNDELIAEICNYITQGASNKRAAILAKIQPIFLLDWLDQAEPIGDGPRERLRDAVMFAREERLHNMQMDAIEKLRQASQRGDTRAMIVLLKEIPQIEHESELLSLEREERREKIEQLRERTQSIREERRRLNLINNTLEFQQQKEKEGEQVSDHAREASEMQKIVKETDPEEFDRIFKTPTAEEDDQQQALLEEAQAKKAQQEAEAAAKPTDVNQQADQADETD